MKKTDEELLQLSAEAQMIWTHPLTQDYLENYIGKLLVRWMAAETVEKRENLWAEAKGVEGFKAHFLSHLAGGRAVEKRKSGGIAEGIGPIV